MTDKDVLIWLSTLNIINRKTIKKLEKHFGNLSSLWDVKEKEIRKIEWLKEKDKSLIINFRNLEYYSKQIEKLKDKNINIITLFDEEYPIRLRDIYDPPGVLYLKGNFLDIDNNSVSIIGSRKATAYGKWACEKFARELSKLGITIISGMAVGIDTIAHYGALKEGGRTLAILGSGVDVVYPSSNKKLYNEISDNGGVFSEFSLGTKPYHYNFPQRNRIISGLSLGVIVIEAKEKSGSLITAHLAIEQGREVFALPGNINSIYSRGTNSLIKDGAVVLRDMDDVLEEIRELKILNKDKKEDSIKRVNLSEDELKIIDVISENPMHCDMISYVSGLSISLVSSILTILEMKGLIKQLPGKVFTLS